MNNPSFLETWGMRLFSALLSFLVALLLAQWAVLNSRVNSIEIWRVQHMDFESAQTAQMAVVMTNQIAVMHRLDNNADKLDELLRLYYTLKGTNGR